MRTFISINLPKEIQKKVSLVQNQIPEFFGKKTKLENLHLTLKFLGEIDEKKVNLVREKLREINFNQFEIRIKSIGVFSKKFIRIIWLGLAGAEELQKVIDKKMKEIGFEKEKRFMGHLTIARVKKIKDREKFLEDLNKIKVFDLKFLVKEFYLMESKSAKPLIYEVLEKYKLV